MMGVTMKVALPMLLVGLIVGLADLGPPGRHADPGADALLHPEDPRPRRGRSRSPARGCSARSSTGRTSSGRSIPQPSTSSRSAMDRQRAPRSVLRAAGRRVLPRPGARLAALHPRAAVLEQDDPGRARAAIVAVALTVGLMPVVKHGTIDLDPLAFGGLILKEVVVGLAFAYALAAMFAAPAGRRLAARHADRLLVRRAGRPGHRQPVHGASRRSTRCSASRSSSRSAATRWVIKGLARTYDAVPLLDAPAIGSMVAGRAGRVLGHLRRRVHDRRAGHHRADHHRRRVRRRLARRAADEHLRGRLPGQDDRRPDADRRLAAVRLRLRRRPAAALGRAGAARR